MREIRYLLLPAILLLLSTLLLKAQIHPKREFRGVWIQAINGQFRGKPAQKVQDMLIGQLDLLEDAGINAVIFQVRVEADALYESNIEPWSRYLTGTQGQAPDVRWDPLAFMIQACHERGMELHAWINPYRAKATLSAASAPLSVVNVHPEWFKSYGGQLFFNPALQECRDYIGQVVADIVSRYDVDAIHMDDYFYPYPKDGEEFDDADDYRRMGAGFASVGDFRRHNVDLLIEQVQFQIKSIKPWVKFGISPFGIYRNLSSDPDGSRTSGLENYDRLYADVLKWTRKGWVDYLVPQVYWQVGHPVADFAVLTEWWARHANNRPMYIGESIANTVANVDPDHRESHQMPLKMNIMRSYKTIMGTSFWYASALAENQGNYREALKKMYYPYLALQPRYPFIDGKAPGKVSKLRDVWTEDGYFLFWTAPRFRNEMDRPVRYVVYCFLKGEKVNLEDPSKIVAITDKTSLRLPYEDGSDKCTFVVTALDRLQNESRPAKRKLRL